MIYNITFFVFSSSFSGGRAPFLGAGFTAESIYSCILVK
jgi:hypothetical protein